MAMYAQEMGSMLALPQGAADTAPMAFGPPVRPSKELKEGREYDIFAGEIMAAIAALKSKLYNDVSS